MPLKVIFADGARVELRKAYEWYGPGHGTRFLQAVGDAVKKIRDHPQRWPVVRGEVRRCRTDKFPYGVLYKVKLDHIRILAVIHLHRDPDYWVGRDDES